MLQSETNTDGEIEEELPFLKEFIAQIAGYLGIWSERRPGVDCNGLPLVAKVASSLSSRCSPNSSQSHPEMFRTGIHFAACAKTVVMSRRSFADRLCYDAAEMNEFVMFGDISLSWGTTLSRAIIRWGENKWLVRRDAWDQLCFPSPRDALWYSFSRCLHRQSLCRHIMGFTHDDKVERSDPAIV